MQKDAMTTRDDILSQLRRGNLTTAELAKRLGLSRNAVVLPLGQLESEGLVRRAALRRSGQAGKPAHEFEIVPGHEDTVSSAYRPFTELLLTVLPRHQTSDDIEKLMLDVGREMAHHIRRMGKRRLTIGWRQHGLWSMTLGRQQS